MPPLLSAKFPCRSSFIDCGITDDDLVDLAACLDNIGRENITLLSLRFNQLTSLRADIFVGLGFITTL